MISPIGYMDFSEIAFWAREVARDLAWAKRTVDLPDGARETVQVPGERDALECWAMANFMNNVDMKLCSAAGVVLRAPKILAKHFDQLEFMLPPLPIEDSSLVLPDYGDIFELGLHNYFRDRFAYFSWQTGCIDVSKVQAEALIGIQGEPQFSEEAIDYLLAQQARQVTAIRQYSGWSICVEQDDRELPTQELYALFGVNDSMIERCGLGDSGYIKTVLGNKPERKRKRDRALDAYEEMYPNGHEAEGVSLKEATNEVSDAIGAVLHVDTMRRALGKKA